MNKFKFEQRFVLFMPLLNLIASSLTKFDQLSIAGINFGHLRGIIIVVFILYFLTSRPIKEIPLFGFLMLLNIYLLVLSLFSSDPLLSIGLWNKFFITSMFFPLGYFYIKTVEDLSRLVKNSYILILLILIYTIFSNYLGVGEANYSEDAISFGEGGVNIIKIIPIILILLPLYPYLNLSINWKKGIILLAVIGILLLVLGFKRGALLGLIVGYLYYILNSPQKKRLLKIIPLIILISVPLIFLLQEKILTVYETRQERGRTSFDNFNENADEGRMLELRWVAEKFPEKSISGQLFGEDFLLGRNDALGIRGLFRMNHMDYTSLLDSSGLIGLFLFIIFYILLFKQLKKHYKNSQRNIFNKELKVVGISLIIILLILGISGTVTSIDIRALSFIILGGILSVLQKNYI